MEPITSNNPHFFHTKFHVLADVLVETMQENIQTYSGWRSWIYKSTAQEERNRSITMIAMVNVLRGGLRKTEQEPVRHQDIALLLLGYAAVDYMGERVKSCILPKMIKLSDYDGNMEVFFIIDKSLGNKVFQDAPPYEACNLLERITSSNRDSDRAVWQLIQLDMRKCRLSKGLFGGLRINEISLAALLDNSRFVEELKASLILDGIRRFRKWTSLGKMDKDTYEMVRRMVIRSLKAELIQRIFDLRL